MIDQETMSVFGVDTCPYKSKRNLLWYVYHENTNTAWVYDRKPEAVAKGRELFRLAVSRGEKYQYFNVSFLDNSMKRLRKYDLYHNHIAKGVTIHHYHSLPGDIAPKQEEVA